VFDNFHDDYEWKTAHHKVDLPVLLVDYGKTSSVVRRASLDFRTFVNGEIASQHDFHGWDAKPPYFEDQTSTEPRSYAFPRSLIKLKKDEVASDRTCVK
jgi:hypothetical protein